MNFNFELADFIARLRLGSRSHYKSVFVRHNNLIFSILALLYKNGVIRGFRAGDDHMLEVFLKYRNHKSVIRKLELITKPSNRANWSLKYLSRKYNLATFSGFYVISTSYGLLTSHECLIRGLCGEVLFKVIV